MIRRKPALRTSDVNGTGNDIVDKGQSLGTLPQRKPGKEQIIVNKGRSVAHLNIQVLTDPGVLLPVVIVEQVAGNPGPLCLPVQPYPPVAVVDMIAAYHGIDRSMEFNTAQFRTGKLPVCINMMDLIPLDQ